MKTQLTSFAVCGLLLLSSTVASAEDYQCTQPSCNYKWLGSDGSLEHGGSVSKFDIISTVKGAVISGSGWQQVSGGGTPATASRNRDDF